MTLGEVFLESISTGVITIQEMAWVGAHQDDFTRAEVATALRLGRLIDEGQVNLVPSEVLRPLRVIGEGGGVRIGVVTFSAER